MNSEDNKRSKPFLLLITNFYNIFFINYIFQFLAQVVAESDVGPQERIRELELELAQVKLAHVEAQCTNQVRIINI